MSLQQHTSENGAKFVDSTLLRNHIQALSSIQAISLENDKLRHRVSILEGVKMKEEYYSTLEEKVEYMQSELAKCSKLHDLGKMAEEAIEKTRTEYHEALEGYKNDLEEQYNTKVEVFHEEQKGNLESWQLQKNQIEQEVYHLKENNAKLENELGEALAVAQENDKIISKLQKRLERYEKLKKRNAELEESENQLEELCSSLENENVSLQDELDNVFHDKKKLKKDQNKLVMKITKYVRRIKEMEQYKNTVARLEFENRWGKHLHDKTLEELRNITAKHSGALKELQGITEERNLLKNELGTVKEEFMKVKNELENSKYSFREFVELKRKLNLLQEENRNLKKSNKCNIKFMKEDTLLSKKDIPRSQLLPDTKLKAITSS